MWYLQHRLLAQVVHLLSDGAFTWMKVWSTNQTRPQEHAGETTWPDVWSDICSFVWRGADTILPESPEKEREKCTPAHAASVHVYPVTPSGWQEEQTFGTCTCGTLVFDSHLRGSGRALSCLCNRSSFWNPLQKEHKSSRFCRTYQKSQTWRQQQGRSKAK